MPPSVRRPRIFSPARAPTEAGSNKTRVTFGISPRFGHRCGAFTDSVSVSLGRILAGSFRLLGTRCGRGWRGIATSDTGY